MAYVAVSECCGHKGIGDKAEKLWETVDPWHPFACWRYWRGGGSIFEDEAAAQQWGAESCTPFNFVGYLVYRRFVVTMVYFATSVLLALIVSGFSLVLTLRVVRHFKISQWKIMSRSAVFERLIQEAWEYCQASDERLWELVPRRVPIVVYLECAIAKLDGDPFNLLTTRQSASCALLQWAYVFLLAAPLHLFVAFAARPQTITLAEPPFRSWFSLPSYLALLHYFLQGSFLLLHSAGCKILWLHGAGRLFHATYVHCTRLAWLSFFSLTVGLWRGSHADPTLPLCARCTHLPHIRPPCLLIASIAVHCAVRVFVSPRPRVPQVWLFLWLCCAVAVNPDYVIKVLSVLGSAFTLFAVSLRTAENFVDETARAFQGIEDDVRRLTYAYGRKMKRLKAKERQLFAAAQRMAVQIDETGKSIFWLFVGVLFLLFVAASWVLLGAFLWGSNATQLTNLIMPIIVAAFKVRADKTVSQVKQLAPSLSAAVVSTVRTTDEVVQVIQADDDDDDEEEELKEESKAEEKVKSFMSQMNRSFIGSAGGVTSASLRERTREVSAPLPMHSLEEDDAERARHSA